MSIVLEPLNETHATRLFELTEQNRNYQKTWLPWLDSVTKVEDTLHFIRATVAQQSLINFVIVYKSNLCGIAGFNRIEENTGFIGYWLSEEYSGKGVMTEAVKQNSELGFSKLLLNRIEIRCAEQNVKSYSVPERLGFKKS